MKTFEEAKKIATSKSYDYLDPRNTDFDIDYDDFMAKTNMLKENIGEIIEKNYADVWETPQGIRFLTRFEKVINIFNFLINPQKIFTHNLLQLFIFLNIINILYKCSFPKYFVRSVKKYLLRNWRKNITLL